jgi:hypothetical protein
MICGFLLYRSGEDKGTAQSDCDTLQVANRMKKFHGDLVASSSKVEMTNSLWIFHPLKRIVICAFTT